MIYDRDYRVGVFVDAANTYICTAKTFNNRKIDYRKMMDFVIGKNNLMRAIIYAVKHGEDKDMSKWCKALNRIGFEVRFKEVSRYGDGNSKADWDVDICMDVVRMINRLDMVVIVSGDGDFVPLVRWCKEQGCIVRIVGVEQSTARKLKEEADIFTPITGAVLMDYNDNDDDHDDHDTDHEQPQPKSVHTQKPAIKYNHNFGKGLIDDSLPTEEERAKLDSVIEEFEREQEEHD